MKLLQKLDEQGLTVKIQHGRVFEGETQNWPRFARPGVAPAASGGDTIACIYDADGNFLAAGVSKCSRKDNFNRKLGTMIAVGRAYCVLTGEAERRRQRKEN